MCPGNQTGTSVILRRRDMSSQYQDQRGEAGIQWIHGFLGIAVLLALLVARSVPPQFPSVASSPSSIHAASSHDQRPRFNYDGPKWGLPAGCFQPLCSSETSSHIASQSSSFSTLQATGLHYQRPPPSV